MEFVNTAISFVTNNWGTIASVAGAVYVIALAIVNFTKTPTDNAILAKVYTVVMYAAGLFTREAQGKNVDGSVKA